jgi:hypothetical protein
VTFSLKIIGECSQVEVEVEVWRVLFHLTNSSADSS